MTDFILRSAELIAWAVLISGFFLGALYLTLLLVAAVSMARRHIERDPSRLSRQFGTNSPGVSILVPAFNETQTVVDSVRALLRQNYHNFEVVVINDGSTDDTWDALHEAFELHSQMIPDDSHSAIRSIYVSNIYPLKIVDKVNGGKGDALNVGISVASLPLFCAIDADSVLEPDALLRAVQPFVEDETTLAVAGTVRVGNDCQMRNGHVVTAAVPNRWLPAIQSVEYLRAFLIARYGWSRLGALMIVSGAFGMFDRSRVMAAGGYATDTVGEDAELIVRLHRHERDAGRPAPIHFVPEPVCWTQVPDGLGDLSIQRRRWQRGALETIGKHRRMIISPRYGNSGWLGLGSMALIDAVGPALEIAGYLAAFILALFGLISWGIFFALFAATSAFGFLLSAAAIALEEIEIRRFSNRTAVLKLLLAAIVENLGYRQLSNLWRLQGSLDHLRGRKGWGKITRSPFRSHTGPDQAKS